MRRKQSWKPGKSLLEQSCPARVLWRVGCRCSRLCLSQVCPPVAFSGVPSKGSYQHTNSDFLQLLLPALFFFFFLKQFAWKSVCLQETMIFPDCFLLWDFTWLPASSLSCLDCWETLMHSLSNKAVTPFSSRAVHWPSLVLWPPWMSQTPSTLLTAGDP